MVNWVSKTLQRILSEGLIFAYQQIHHKMNKISTMAEESKLIIH